MMITDRQKAVAAAIKRGQNGILSADRIAYALGYRPARNGRLAISATLRAMQKSGLVGRIPPEDQWDCATYFLTKLGTATFNET